MNVSREDLDLDTAGEIFVGSQVAFRLTYDPASKKDTDGQTKMVDTTRSTFIRNGSPLRLRSRPADSTSTTH